MNNRIRAFALAALLSLGLLLLPGCELKSGADLYSLPKAPQEYMDLQEKIDEVLATGAEYSAPVSGDSRQSVQLVDLDLDGTEEAVAFFKTTDEKPLKVYIFKYADSGYEAACVIEGEGSAFDTVDYVQLDGKGPLELIVGRQISTEVSQILSIYDIKDYDAVEMASIIYTEYVVCDLDSEQINELVVTNFDSTSMTGTVSYYDYENGRIEQADSAPMSKSIKSLSSIKTGYLLNFTPAVFVTGNFGDAGLITDIFAINNSVFSNITLDARTGRSDSTIRSLRVSALDINGDMVTEIPVARKLPEYEGLDSGSFWKTTWYAYKRNGSSRQAMVTYHNYSDGWYLNLTDKWDSNIVLARADISSAARCVVFYEWDGGSAAPAELFRIYTLTGDNRYSRINSLKCFALKVGDNAIYAAKFASVSDSELEEAKADLISRFSLIISEWETGIID